MASRAPWSAKSPPPKAPCATTCAASGRCARRYHRAGKDRLVITLSGGGGGKTEAFDLKRVAD
ncbi:MAG TPA: hypothetical protein VFY93_12785 [Planctomycetota bacterium]|nr:hypothetical protein [Planctomycetota bacterium]